MQAAAPHPVRLLRDAPFQESTFTVLIVADLSFRSHCFRLGNQSQREGERRQGGSGLQPDDGVLGGSAVVALTLAQPSAEPESTQPCPATSAVSTASPRDPPSR